MYIVHTALCSSSTLNHILQQYIVRTALCSSSTLNHILQQYIVRTALCSSSTLNHILQQREFARLRFDTPAADFYSFLTDPHEKRAEATMPKVGVVNACSYGYLAGRWALYLPLDARSLGYLWCTVSDP
jgi:hypothetical protein